ncbi:MAG: hypothetical protein NZM35_04850 [Chitinophagales bacterium]|nr:hypothetical protein [Chitinophagales bacterium]MDW8419220.1 hypothetical protein [Chitinophagales bacterium]
MLIVGLLLCYLLGASLMLLISRRYSLPELLGYAYLTGIATESVIMLLFDVAGIKITSGTMIVANVVLITAALAVNHKGIREGISQLKLPPLRLHNVNLVAWFFVLLMAWLYHAVSVKGLFWPATDHDAIGSFDKLGRIIAAEGKIKISLYQWNLQGAAGVYPPLFNAALAYAYVFGAMLSKIIITLFFLSFLLVFYSLMKETVNHTAAAVTTFVLMLTPEMFAHAALGLGNMPTAAYVCAGALSTFIWIDKKDEKYFWIGALMMAWVVWIRSDTVVFTAAALLIMAMDYWRHKNLKKMLLYGFVAVLPFVVWYLYMKLKLHTTTSGRFDFSIGYVAERFDMVWGYIRAMLFAGQYGSIDGGQLYGIVFVLFFLMLAINFLWMFQPKLRSTILTDRWHVLVFFAASFIAYTLLFYFIDEKAQNSPLYSLMESSFKRGMFCFVPVALYYSATNYTASRFWQALEKFRTGA